MALGRNPRATAREARDALGGNRTRALTIARTETLRAYREASRETYRQNRAVVQGWTWWSSLDRRTCPVCWAMHGSEHSLDEPLGSHPSCRCSMLPLVRPALAAADRIEPGPEQFARLAEARQLEVLGPGKLAAYKAGEIGLDDVVAFRRDPRWGPVRNEASLATARENAGGRLRQAA